MTNFIIYCIFVLSVPDSINEFYNASPEGAGTSGGWGIFIMTEQWKDIEGYEGLYRISNHGRVKRVVGWQCDKERIRLPNTNGWGCYKTVNLCKNARYKKCFVHRLVAAAFVPNPDNKPEVNHKDGDKMNVNPKNLEWVTSSENNFHAYAIGLKKPKLNDLQKRIIAKSGDLPGRYLGKIFGVNKKTIYKYKDLQSWQEQKVS